MELEGDVLVSPTVEVPVIEGDVVAAIRTLAARGVGKKTIAREVGVAVNTVRRYLRQPIAAGVQTRPAARRLRDEDRVVLRYVDNPDGSLDDIAGIANEAGNVVGLMPHPERASDPLLGSADGVVLLESMLAAATRRAAAA